MFWNRRHCNLEGLGQSRVNKYHLRVSKQREIGRIRNETHKYGPRASWHTRKLQIQRQGGHCTGKFSNLKYKIILHKNPCLNSFLVLKIIKAFLISVIHYKLFYQ